MQIHKLGLFLKRSYVFTSNDYHLSYETLAEHPTSTVTWFVS